VGRYQPDRRPRGAVRGQLTPFKQLFDYNPLFALLFACWVVRDVRFYVHEPRCYIITKRFNHVSSATFFETWDPYP
jgi:hypothetical protein